MQIIPNETLDRWTINDKIYLKELLNKYINTDIKKGIVEWCEDNRKILSGTPRPGQFNMSVTPYLREILACFDESSLIQIVDIMKGAQIGATVGVDENLMLYLIGCSPRTVLFVAQTAEVAEMIFTTRMDPAIDSANLRGHLIPQSIKKANKATGDTKSLKQFKGGWIMVAGLASISKLKTMSASVLIITEVDEAVADLKGQGSPVVIAIRRTDAFTLTRKILIESTPTEAGTSVIEARFNDGDRSYYHVPCKECGKLQRLVWGQINYTLNNNSRLIETSVYYQCKYCEAKWNNADKEFFLQEEGSPPRDSNGDYVKNYKGRAKWISTTKAIEAHRRSFHISSLYSPVGFRSWADICKQYIQALEEINDIGDHTRMKVFYNQVLGETYKVIADSPPYKKIYEENRLKYGREYFNQNNELIQCTLELKTLPHNPCFLSIATDVQKII